MAFINWNKKYSVNIDSIDEQHKVLVGMINNFYEEIKNKSHDDLIADLIKEMKEYTVFHFTTEENYFKKYNFSDFEDHKLEHNNFVDKVIDLEKRFAEGKIIITFEITDYLKNWLYDHIQGTDMKYSNFLREKGVV